MNEGSESDALDDACDAALDGEQFGRKGQYTGGRLDVRVR